MSSTLEKIDENNKPKGKGGNKAGKGGKYSPDYKKRKTIDPELDEIIIGLLLGDIHVRRDKSTHNSRLQFKQSTIHKEYIDHLYNRFNEYVSDISPRTIEYYDKRYEKSYFSAAFETLSFPCFNKYRELFYNNEGKKKIPLNIGELLTARSLAYWIMDDGGQDPGFILNTNSFTKEEVELLIKVLDENFGIKGKLRPRKAGQYVIYFSKSKITKIREIVAPYIHLSMLYKVTI